MSRHPGTEHLMRTLEPNPNLPLHLSAVSQKCWGLAQTMLGMLEDGPELTAGLRKLRDARDCFVIQALHDYEYRKSLAAEVSLDGPIGGMRADSTIAQMKRDKEAAEANKAPFEVGEEVAFYVDGEPEPLVGEIVVIAAVNGVAVIKTHRGNFLRDFDELGKR